MKILILGDGLLGKELVKQTNWDFISRKKNGIDVSDFNKWCYKMLPYDVIVNCIAYTNSYSNEKDKHYKINYEFVSWLVKFCNEYDKKLIQISTEFVYANNKIPPTEEDIPQPDQTWYAYSKLLADEYIQLKSNNYLICRELHKPNPFPYPEVWDVQTSGDTVDKIVNLITQLIHKDAKGVFNVGIGSKNLKTIAPHSKIIPPPLHIPLDTRMDLSKLNKVLNE